MAKMMIFHCFHCGLFLLFTKVAYFVTLLVIDLDDVQEVAIHDKQHFHTELARFQEAHDSLIQQLEAAQESHHTLEKTLAMLIMEKEEIAKENADLKVVCEETMGLLETYEKDHNVVQG